VALPIWGKIIVFIINSFFPDPIPLLDEIFMVAATIRDILRLHKMMQIVEWIRSHKVQFVLIVLGIVALVAIAIFLIGT
jgi:hypothetical protein